MVPIGSEVPSKKSSMSLRPLRPFDAAPRRADGSLVLEELFFAEDALDRVRESEACDVGASVE